MTKENENLLDKLKKSESESQHDLKKAKDDIQLLSQKLQDMESQSKSLSSTNQKLLDKLKESELIMENLRQTINEQQEKLEELEKEREHYMVQFAQQKDTSAQYEGDLQYLEKEFNALKEDIQLQNDELKNELLKEKCRYEDLLFDHQQQETKLETIKSERESFASKIQQLEDELKETQNKVAYFKKLNEDLEERNYKLMDTLHQDINARSKQFKGKTLAALAQSDAHKILQQMKDSGKDTFSFRGSEGSKGKGGLSPPQNLKVESTDDVAEFENIIIRTAAKRSPMNDLSKTIGEAPILCSMVQSPSRLLQSTAQIKLPSKKETAKQLKSSIESKISGFEQRLKDTIKK